MASLASRLGFLAVLLSLVATGIGERSDPEAYVTLLYGDEFLLGVRVLGKSIRDTGSERDMVALVSDGVSDFAKDLLQFVIGTTTRLPVYLGAASIFFCFFAAILSLALAFMIVPRQVMPWIGLMLMYEWTFTTFFIVFGCYLQLVYQWGRTRSQAGGPDSCNDSSDYESRKGHQHRTFGYDIVTLSYGTGMALLAVIAPSLPCILGVTALFAKLGLMVAGGIVLASFMSYASEHLAIRSFVRGHEDRDLPRTRIISSLVC